MLVVIERTERETSERKLMIGLNIRKACRRLKCKINKLSISTQHTGAEIVRMRKILKNEKFCIEFKLVRGNELIIASF